MKRQDVIKKSSAALSALLFATLIAACSGDSNSSGSQNSVRNSTPTICSDSASGDCECSNAEGFTTWTWWVADQQRCATAYVPPSVQGPLPVLISNDSYSRNRLGDCRIGSEMVTAADRFGFVGLCTTSAEGNWTFGNDGVINDANPTACEPEDSKDITYLDGVFRIIDGLGLAGQARSDEIYTWGFSQNAMFTAFTAFCYPDRISAFWQGGSGLYVQGQTAPLPRMEGACRHSDFVEYGPACAMEAPCPECQYFPVYPVPTTPPLAGCIMAYQDDFLFETTAPMAELMSVEGHTATLLQFPAIGREHSQSLIHWDWLVGCMGVVEACSSTCADAMVACMDTAGSDSAVERESDHMSCLASELVGCDAGCAPTLEMLRLVERPCVVDGICEQGETAASCPSDC